MAMSDPDQTFVPEIFSDSSVFYQSQRSISTITELDSVLGYDEDNLLGGHHGLCSDTDIDFADQAQAFCASDKRDILYKEDSFSGNKDQDRITEDEKTMIPPKKKETSDTLQGEFHTLVSRALKNVDKGHSFKVERDYKNKRLSLKEQHLFPNEIFNSNLNNTCKVSNQICLENSTLHQGVKLCSSEVTFSKHQKAKFTQSSGKTGTDLKTSKGCHVENSFKEKTDDNTSTELRIYVHNNSLNGSNLLMTSEATPNENQQVTVPSVGVSSTSALSASPSLLLSLMGKTARTVNHSSTSPASSRLKLQFCSDSSTMRSIQGKNGSNISTCTSTSPSILRQMISTPSQTPLTISPTPRQTLGNVTKFTSVEDTMKVATSKLDKAIKCKCKFNKGEPCWKVFEEDKLRKERLHHLKMPKKSLDLVLLAKIAATMNREEKTKKKQNLRQRCRLTYYHEGRQICRETFLFIHGICKGKLIALMKHYKNEGISARIHGNKKNVPHHALSDEDQEKVLDFIRDYANNHFVSSYGRKHDSKAGGGLLIMAPSQSKVYVHYQYKQWCLKNNIRAVSLRSFRALWCKHLSYIVVLRGSNKTPVPGSSIEDQDSDDNAVSESNDDDYDIVMKSRLPGEAEDNEFCSPMEESTDFSSVEPLNYSCSNELTTNSMNLDHSAELLGPPPSTDDVSSFLSHGNEGIPASSASSEELHFLPSDFISTEDNHFQSEIRLTDLESYDIGKKKRKRKGAPPRKLETPPGFSLINHEFVPQQMLDDSPVGTMTSNAMSHSSTSELNSTGMDTPISVKHKTVSHSDPSLCLTFNNTKQDLSSSNPQVISPQCTPVPIILTSSKDVLCSAYPFSSKTTMNGVLKSPQLGLSSSLPPSVCQASRILDPFSDLVSNKAGLAPLSAILPDQTSSLLHPNAFTDFASGTSFDWQPWQTYSSI